MNIITLATIYRWAI